MRKVKKSFLEVVLLFIILMIPLSCDSSETIKNNNIKSKNAVLSIGGSDSKITIKVFSSLTCPHCANFHTSIFEKLKKEYIESGIVKFEHHSFPLDLAALNAELIIRCHQDINRSFQLLGEIYKKQNQWAVGSDINVINKSIKKIGLNSGLDDSKMNKCLNDERAQENVLNERINAQKKYKIESTPTIYINEKLYKNKHNYKQFKKTIEKLL